MELLISYTLRIEKKTTKRHLAKPMDLVRFKLTAISFADVSSTTELRSSRLSLPHGRAGSMFCSYPLL